MEEHTREQKLMLTIHNKARSICAETGHSMDVTYNDEALELIGEVAWTVTRNFARDLELFARHAKRSTVNADDVKLLVRKNPAMTKTVTKMANEQAAAKQKPATSKRKKTKEDVSTDVENEEPMPSTSWLPGDLEDFMES